MSRPTTSMPIRSPGCAGSSRPTGGLVIISHDVDLLAAVVNKVAFLDADRQVLDHYNVGWDAYLKAGRPMRSGVAGSEQTPTRQRRH